MASDDCEGKERELTNTSLLAMFSVSAILEILPLSDTYSSDLRPNLNPILSERIP